MPDPYDAVQDARSDRGEWNEGDVADDAAEAFRWASPPMDASPRSLAVSSSPAPSDRDAHVAATTDAEWDRLMDRLSAISDGHLADRTITPGEAHLLLSRIGSLQVWALGALAREAKFMEFSEAMRRG